MNKLLTTAAILYGIIGLVLITMSLSGCTDDPEVLPSPKPTTHKSLIHWNWLDNSKPTMILSDTQDLLRKNYYVVVDGSGSMSGEKIQIASKAIMAFTSKLNNDDALGLVVFDDYGTSERVALHVNSTAQFKRAIEKIETGGGTPLQSAIKLAYEKLVAEAANQKGYGEYHIIVVTDGEANTFQDPGDLVRTITQSSPIQIHTIGFQFSGVHSLNQQGITDYYQADDYDSLMISFSSIMAESTDFNQHN